MVLTRIGAVGLLKGCRHRHDGGRTDRRPFEKLRIRGQRWTRRQRPVVSGYFGLAQVRKEEKEIKISRTTVGGSGWTVGLLMLGGSHGLLIELDAQVEEARSL
jgi:hypothetical protein